MSSVYWDEVRYCPNCGSIVYVDDYYAATETCWFCPHR